jgi:hypothetical protein
LKWGRRKRKKARNLSETSPGNRKEKAEPNGNERRKPT